jgi:hypothetical protein
MPLPKDLLELLICPFCHGDLREEGESLKCLRRECGLIFAVRDGIPDMLVDEARRPCPGCQGDRDLKTERSAAGVTDHLLCPRCGAKYTSERK